MSERMKTVPISVISFQFLVQGEGECKKGFMAKKKKVSLFVKRIKRYFRTNFCSKVVFRFPKVNLSSPVLISINQRPNFCVVIHDQTNFAQVKYFMPKAICLPVGPMMGFPMFPLVWNARSKRAYSSGEWFPSQFPNIDHIWGLLGACAPSSPFSCVSRYLHRQFGC